MFTPEALRHLAAESAPSQIVMGTDYPFPWTKDGGGPHPQHAGLSDDDKRGMLGETAAKLLKL